MYAFFALSAQRQKYRWALCVRSLNFYLKLSVVNNFYAVNVYTATAREQGECARFGYRIFTLGYRGNANASNRRTVGFRKFKFSCRAAATACRINYNFCSRLNFDADISRRSRARAAEFNSVSKRFSVNRSVARIYRDLIARLAVYR